MTLETARRIDAYYTRLTWQGHPFAWGNYAQTRWGAARAYLIANDPDYIWDN
jgi:hypothetical protein